MAALSVRYADALHTPDFREALSMRYADWQGYNTFECDWLRPRLAAFTPQHVLLVHCPDKARLLGLTLLGEWKTSWAVMQRVAQQRHDTCSVVRHNWESLRTAQIMDTHDDIEQAVLAAVEDGVPKCENVHPA